MQGRLLSKKKNKYEMKITLYKNYRKFVFKVKNTIKFLYHTQQFEPLYFSYLMYTGGRLAIYHKNKYTEEKKP